VNCGQELFDVIEVIDAGAGLTAARRCVAGISLQYSTGERPVYEQQITLGAAEAMCPLPPAPDPPSQLGKKVSEALQ
jgi:hypothetical protein